MSSVGDGDGLGVDVKARYLVVQYNYEDRNGKKPSTCMLESEEKLYDYNRWGNGDRME